jgi:hypothetical protein
MRALALVTGALLLAGCGTTVAGTPAPSTDETRLCASQAPVDLGVLAPCVEFDRFRQRLRELGVSDTMQYRPSSAAETCRRKAAGLPIQWQSSVSGLDELHRAILEAEIAARCPG